MHTPKKKKKLLVVQTLHNKTITLQQFVVQTGIAVYYSSHTAEEAGSGKEGSCRGTRLGKRVLRERCFSVMVTLAHGRKEGQGKRLGKYELGRTLGEGNFGKVKLARDTNSGKLFAVKILEKNKIIDLNNTDQIKREISTLKLLKHPNVVRLYEVLASKTKIYMVLEYVNGGELFDKIASKGKLEEAEGRKIFQQLIDGVSFCHNKGVFHRDLKLENVLVDAKGNIKITDFNLSALPQHFRDDGLLHTTCGSPNYVAPEILANKGYDGGTSDIWSCGVILYVILTGYLPFDDRNLAVLYQKIPRWLSAGARNMIKRMLDPNPKTRITMTMIKEDEWFKEDYIPANPEDEEEGVFIDDEAFSIHNASLESDQGSPTSSTLVNAFQLIGMSSSLDLSGLFEKEDVTERKIRFTSTHSPKDLEERIEDIVTGMRCRVQKKNGMLKVTQDVKAQKCLGSLSVIIEVFEISPTLYVVELSKCCGDASVYRQLCQKLSNELGFDPNQQLESSEMIGLLRENNLEAINVDV
ncbi:CBL-interacting serine/threonine-protein kinase 1 isoform X2 [Vigna radiata var. radiata]|uniref:non-specific serine/threonine protein kinase n=1 Tax=Vigna radiata var. radiata TaxID=3916 RepID=A0A1S3VU09_VIGRR|nr:CBL-interacting serine/threonine-protein kinase 1 isoform X2 [Vigna radiata var. radiata]